MRNVQAAASGRTQNGQGGQRCDFCRAPVTWVHLALGQTHRDTMVERCARGAGDVAIEATLIAFGAAQMPGAYPATGTNWRKHQCEGSTGKPRAFSADAIPRKTRENTQKSPSISYRTKGSVNSRGGRR